MESNDLMELEAFLEKQEDLVRRCAIAAERYEELHALTLFEYSRHAQKVVGDFVDETRETCKNIADARVLLERWRYETWNDYNFYHEEHFDHLAELSMTKYIVLGLLDFDKELFNKSFKKSFAKYFYNKE